MSTITAKAIVAKVDEQDAEQTAIHLQADYGTDAEPINQEWARYTPMLNILMVVKNEVATQFPILGKFKVTFELDDQDKAPAEQPTTPAAPAEVAPAVVPPAPPASEAPAPADPTPAAGTTPPEVASSAPAVPASQPEPSSPATSAPTAAATTENAATAPDAAAAAAPAEASNPQAELLYLTRQTALAIAKDGSASPQMVDLAHRLLDVLDQLQQAPASPADPTPAAAPVDVTAIAPAAVTHQ